MNAVTGLQWQSVTDRHNLRVFLIGFIKRPERNDLSETAGSAETGKTSQPHT